ncbi:MAG TPA: hypothetical protein VK854_05365 [Woeseiaceae bacterium]|nr:hypothetical protein [Woeseiaceae bacterium]
MRRLVLLSGALLFIAGLAFVPVLAVAAGLKAVLAITWTCLCGYEWLAFRRGYAASRALRIAAGGHVERQCRDGSWQPVRLCAGSVVLSRFAWLRVAPPGAWPYSELLSAASHESEDWRRLQVIWRHIGAA